MVCTYILFKEQYVRTVSLKKQYARRNGTEETIPKKWYVCTISLYEETVYHSFVQRNGTPFLYTKGTYVLFLCTKKWYVQRNSMKRFLCTKEWFLCMYYSSLYKEAVCTYVHTYIHTYIQIIKLGVGGSKGNPVQMQCCTVVDMRNGKVSYMDTYMCIQLLFVIPTSIPTSHLHCGDFAKM